MTRLILLATGLLMSVSAFAQAANDAGNAAERALHRSQIQAQRQQLEVNYSQREKACYARFAVTDCLESLRSERRSKLDLLRAQEVALDDADREQKAMEKMRRLSVKESKPP